MSSIYQRAISSFDKFVPAKFQPLWIHPAGPKTIFFWAPLCKWGLVIAGIGDMQRPPDTISVPQTGALVSTGCIWSRYSLVVVPKNWSLFSVNVFIVITGMYQLIRALSYSKSEH